MRQSSCWGWAKWNRAWRPFHRRGAPYIDEFASSDIYSFNLDGAFDYWGQLVANERGLLKTWAIYWYACVFSKNGLCLHPRASLVENIGHDGSGVDCSVSNVYNCLASVRPIEFFPDVIKENAESVKRLASFLRGAERKSSTWSDFLKRTFKGASDKVFRCWRREK